MLLYQVYVDLFFTYLEVNPLGKGKLEILSVCDILSVVVFVCVVLKDKVVYMLDLAARLDSTAEYLCKKHWGNLEFPPPFGREALPEVSKYSLCIESLTPSS